MSEDQAQRFWSKVDKTDSCWLWTGSLDHNSYGQVRIAYKLKYAHRIAYEAQVARIPVGLVLDHLCKTPACVRPDHLEPVTQSINIKRGAGNGNREKTHCKWGHPFDNKNTRLTNCGWGVARQCIPCKVAYDKERYLRRKHAQSR